MWRGLLLRLFPRVLLSTDYRPKERVLSDRSGSSATAVRVLLVEMTVAGSCVDLHRQCLQGAEVKVKRM